MVGEGWLFLCHTQCVCVGVGLWGGAVPVKPKLWHVCLAVRGPTCGGSWHPNEVRRYGGGGVLAMRAVGVGPVMAAMVANEIWWGVSWPAVVDQTPTDCRDCISNL